MFHGTNLSKQPRISKPLWLLSTIRFERLFRSSLKKQPDIKRNIAPCRFWTEPHGRVGRIEKPLAAYFLCVETDHLRSNQRFMSVFLFYFTAHKPPLPYPVTALQRWYPRRPARRRWGRKSHHHEARWHEIIIMTTTMTISSSSTTTATIYCCWLLW